MKTIKLPPITREEIISIIEKETGKRVIVMEPEATFNNQTVIVHKVKLENGENVTVEIWMEPVRTAPWCELEPCVIIKF